MGNDIVEKETPRSREVMAGDGRKISLEEIEPAEIERRSFAIIRDELRERKKKIPEEQLPVVCRVIHTTADFEYADTLYFSPDVLRLAKEALVDGAPIITDTNMARAGISKPAAAKLGIDLHCFMADQDVAEAAKKRGLTRAWVSMEKAAELEKKTGRSCILAIGNAPTALAAIYELVAQGRLHPRLIIAVPVGFVNVVPAKELIMSLPKTPVIAARGRKGGSAVAACIVNALLYSITRH